MKGFDTDSSASGMASKRHPVVRPMSAGWLLGMDCGRCSRAGCCACPQGTGGTTIYSNPGPSESVSSIVFSSSHTSEPWTKWVRQPEVAVTTCSRIADMALLMAAMLAHTRQELLRYADYIAAPSSAGKQDVLPGLQVLKEWTKKGEVAVRGGSPLYSGWSMIVQGCFEKNRPCSQFNEQRHLCVSSI